MIVLFINQGLKRTVSECSLLVKIFLMKQKNKKAPARAKEEYLLITKLFCGK